MIGCRWILTPASPGVLAIYCGDKVPKRMKIDDETGKRYTSYDTFCVHHQNVVQSREQTEQLDEGNQL